MNSTTTQQRILDATARLVQLKGFGATSISDVLEASRVKKGTLYHYFENKDALGLAVLQRDRDEFMAFIDESLVGASAFDAVGRFFKAALEKHKSTGFSGGCLWGNTALEMSDTHTDFKQIVEDVFSEWVTRIEAVIRRGQDAGEFRSDATAMELAHMVVAAMEGGIMLSRLSKQDKPLRICLRTLCLMLAQNPTEQCRQYGVNQETSTGNPLAGEDL